MRDIVINTGPLIALVAATDSLEWLPKLYGRIVVPTEVSKEIEAGGSRNPEYTALQAVSAFFHSIQPERPVPQVLVRELDLGEASVIHSALQLKIATVAIDEKAGRRVARLHGLKVTGSLGILIQAKQRGLIDLLAPCLARMRNRGIWMSSNLQKKALETVGES